MQLGLNGLGKMGGNMRERLRRAAVRRLAHYTWSANARIVLGEILATLGLPDLDSPLPQLSVGDLS
jgi:6-phosphogluconate dehydrogenase (decarboxylating)